LSNIKYIFLITVDCLRADHVGCIGGGDLTPNIDRLARDSLVFTRAFANGPATNQSFPAILTSTYFLMHGGMRLLSGYTTLAEVLRSHGFKTVAFHSNPFLSKSLGWGRGFDEFYDFMGFIKSPSAAAIRSDFSAKLANFINRITRVVDNNHLNSFLRRIYFLWNKFEMPYVNGEMLNNHVTKWILRNKDQRFFLWMHYMDPHRPYIPPPPYLHYFETREEAFIFDTLIHSKISQGKVSIEELKKLKILYEGEIKYVDYCIGELMEFLKIQDLLEDSLLILTADHGEGFNEHNKLTHPYDTVYNEVIHVPLLFYGLTDYTGVVDKYTQLLDVPPTIIDVLRGKLPHTFLGKSLIPALEGEWQYRPIFSESAKPDIMNLRYDTSKKVISCIMEDWKLIINEFGGTTELYNIHKDFSEKINLVRDELEVREKLTAIIEEHLDFERSFKSRAELKALERKRIKKLLKTMGYSKKGLL